MSISENDKRAIAEAVEELHFVETDQHGQKFIRIFADYRDTNEDLLQPAYDHRHKGFENKEDTKSALRDALVEKINIWNSDTTLEKEREILRRAGFDLSDDRIPELLEYLRDTYPLIPDYDHYLNQDMRVNVMLDAGDREKHFFSGIYEQYQAMICEPPAEELTAALQAQTGLSWLIQQQGHTMEELKETLDDYLVFFDKPEVKVLNSEDAKEVMFCSNHNKFLASVCKELTQAPDSHNTMTVLARMSLNQFADFMQPGKEVILPKESMIGMFNPWTGAGSLMEIELEKDLVVPSDLLYDIQIEGVKTERGLNWTLDSAYGLVHNAWQPATCVQDAQIAPEGRKPSLMSLIASAENRTDDGSHVPTNAPEISNQR